MYSRIIIDVTYQLITQSISGVISVLFYRMILCPKTSNKCYGILRLVQLTHLSLASLLWDIGKQSSPRCDAAKRGVPSGAILFA